MRTKVFEHYSGERRIKEGFLFFPRTLSLPASQRTENHNCERRWWERAKIKQWYGGFSGTWHDDEWVD